MQKFVYFYQRREKAELPRFSLFLCALCASAFSALMKNVVFQEMELGIPSGIFYAS